MPLPAKKTVVRELLWLLSILVAAVPLSVALHWLAGQVPAVGTALLTVLRQPGYVAVLLYGLVVLACYLGRLGAAGAAYLTTATPEA